MGNEKKAYIILGNGFSIDLINELGKSDVVDLTNLFRLGDRVHWPADNIPGFISFQHCPNLWTLGGRPNSSKESSSRIIDDIISCANFNTIIKKSLLPSENIYDKAYYELVAYLRYLFVYYNGKVNDSEISDITNSWGWSKLFKALNNSPDISSVTVITYNYDLFLERTLKNLSIDYDVAGFGTCTKKFRIFKPHGSISFTSKTPSALGVSEFSISVIGDRNGGKIDEYIIDEDVEPDKPTSLYAMIPPFGEATRFSETWNPSTEDSVIKDPTWASCLRINARKEVLASDSDDYVFIGGLSYCNVDRSEIDFLLKNINKKVNLYNINPDCNSTFAAVISSNFENYTHYTNSIILGDFSL